MLERLKGNAGGFLTLVLILGGTAFPQTRGGQIGAPLAAAQRAPDIMGRIIASGAPQSPVNVPVRIETASGTEVAFVYTDGAGNFRFRAIELNPAESHYIVVEVEGFRPYREPLDYQVDGRRDSILNILLEAEPRQVAPAGADSRVVDVGQLLADVPDEAREEYDRALEDIESGRDAEAAERLERVVAMAPDFFDAFDALGAAYLTMGRHGDALTALNRAMELNPGAARPLLNLGALSYQVGETQLQANEPEAALKAYVTAIDFLEEAIQREPLAGLAYQYLGAALHRMGDYERAESSLHEALRLNPDLDDARLILINVYTRQSRYDDALQELDAYVGDNPSSDRLPALERLRGQIEAALSQ